MLFPFSAAAACLLLTACSCAVTGTTYAPAKGSHNITPAMLDDFAKDSDFRKQSETTYRRGWVNLSYIHEISGLGFNGSFCSLPHELLFSSPSEVFRDVANSEREAEAWFDQKGIHLQKVTIPAAHPD
jgi:hypothetical protein